MSLIISFVFFTLLNIGLSEKSISKSKYLAKEPHKGHHPWQPSIAAVPVQTFGKRETTTQSCPTGYWLEGGRCVKKEEVPPTSVCPSGTLDEGQKCLKFSPARFTCHGGTLIGDECVKEIKAPKQLSCPHKAELHGHVCKLEIELPPVCPENTAEAGDRCVTSVPIQKICPKGFHPHGSVCSKTESAQPFLQCPHQFHLEGHTCILKVPIEPVCPSGTIDEGKFCATFAPKERKCPHGFTMAGGECIKTETKPKNVFCANGRNPEDHCKEEIAVPLSPTCKEPFKLVNGACEVIRTTPASFSCPEGYFEERGKCVKSVDYDCSITKHEIECEKPVKPSKPGHVRRLFDPKKDQAKAKYVHEKQSYPAPVLPVCHKVPIVTPKTCQRTIFAEGSPFCHHEGVYKGGNICEVVERHHPEFKCDGQTDRHGNCFVTETSQPIRVCPEGYSRSNGEFCARTEVTDIILVCPPHTEGPNCATFVEKKCPGGKCEKVITERAIVICPEGFAKSESHHDKEVCIKVLFADELDICPPKTEKHGLECLSFQHKIRKFDERTFPAFQQCPTGFADEGSVCLRKEFSPAIPVCPDHSIFQDNRCATVVPKIHQCPKGSVAEKGKCWVFEKTEPLIVDTVVGNKHHTISHGKA